VRINQYLHYGFKTFDLSTVVGISASDVAALGQRDLSPGLGLVVFTPNAPKPARFAKQSPKIQAIGDGSTAAAINTAAAAGWRQTRGIKRAAISNTAKSTEVIVPTTNNLYVLYRVPNAEATPANSSLMGWVTTAGTITLSKSVRSPSKIKIPLVKKGSITLPCASSRIAAAEAEGWHCIRNLSGISPLL
jgi:hypothetical protein